jgi:hypothetical protein
MRRALARRAQDRTPQMRTIAGSGFLEATEPGLREAEVTTGPKRRVRTRRFLVITGDPALSFSYYVRRRLYSRHPAQPAKLIDPKTGEVRGWMDPVTRRIYRDAACTIPCRQPTETRGEGPAGQEPKR